MYDRCDPWGLYTQPRFVDENGRPVERDRFSHPYSYDPYVLWKSKTFDINTGGCVYSDRMQQWDNLAFGRASRAINHKGGYFDDLTETTASKFLSEYFEKPVKCDMLMQGCNVSNGYPYWVFFYKDI